MDKVDKIEHKDGTLSDAWLHQAVEGSPVPTMVIDSRHVIRHWNRALAVVSGVAAEDMVGTNRSWAAFYDHARPIMADLIVEGALTDDFDALYSGKCRRSELLPGAWDGEDFFPNFPGGGKWLSFTAAPLRDAAGRLVGAIETLRDITAERRAEQARREGEHLLREIIDGCPVPMLVLDSQHRITHWNRSCAAMVDTAPDQLIGTHDQWKPFYPAPRQIMADLVIDGNDEQAVAQLYSGKYTRSGLIPGAWEAMDYFPNFRTGERWLYFTAAPLHGLDGQVMGAVETLQDITAQKAYETKLEHQATHDALTGLANRSLLNDRIAQALAHAGREERLIAVLFIDLDNFKIINDTLGHAVGDELVRQVARRIAACVRAGDTVARIGGDEFVVLLYAPESEQAVVEVIRRLLADIAQPVMVGEESLVIGCSVGAACYPRDGKDATSLLMNADTAMYRAKQSGRNTFHFFTREMNDKVTQRMSLERDLRQAVDNGELTLHYQPQVSVASGRIVGAEALLRWNHPRLGLLPPAHFIPLAEETGLIVPIGQWVMQAAGAEARRWTALSASPMNLAVNLSPRQFRDGRLLREVEDLLTALGKDSVYLELEVTESMVMEDSAAAASIMGQLKDMGVRLSMDDFGTGYSSLGYLRNFPFDLIKIDRSFVAGLGRGKGTEAIVRAIIGLADSFNLAVIAEGVETHEQGIMLASEGCLLAQGFYYGKPMAAEDFRSRMVARPVAGHPMPWQGAGL